MTRLFAFLRKSVGKGMCAMGWHVAPAGTEPLRVTCRRCKKARHSPNPFTLELFDRWY